MKWPHEAHSTSTGVCATRPLGRCRAIVDTGTYLIYGPRRDVQRALGSIAVEACADVATLPTLTFVLYNRDGDDARLTLRPHDYTLEYRIPPVAAHGSTKGAVDDVGGECDDATLEGTLEGPLLGGNLSARRGASACVSDCVVGIGPDNDLGWTFGQVFLRSFYTVFDRDHDRIGFAERARE